MGPITLVISIRVLRSDCKDQYNFGDLIVKIWYHEIVLVCLSTLDLKIDIMRGYIYSNLCLYCIQSFRMVCIK